MAQTLVLMGSLPWKGHECHFLSAAVSQSDSASSSSLTSSSSSSQPRCRRRAHLLSPDQDQRDRAHGGSAGSLQLVEDIMDDADPEEDGVRPSRFQERDRHAIVASELSLA